MQSAYFSQMAGVAATLLGLSFLALTFYLGSLDKRYTRLVLPVFLYEIERRRSSSAGDLTSSIPPLKVNDLQLFDRDPVIVFLAFSTSLSWNFYFLALIFSLTVIDPGLDTPWLLAVESVFFAGTISYSVLSRRKRYSDLNTYRTAEERLWTPGEWLIILAMIAVMIICLFNAISVSCATANDGVCAFTAHGALKSGIADLTLYTIKVATLGAICLGLYVTNKDLFVFFKARTSDEIRGRWLDQFVNEFPQLQLRVESALASNDPAAPDTQRLAALWNHGMPPKSYIRSNYSPKPNGEVPPGDPRWNALLAGTDVVSTWMFDTPGLAAWSHDLERAIQQSSSTRVS